MNLIDFYFYSLCILSFSLAISSLEYLFSWNIFSSSGILSWKVSKLSTAYLSKSRFSYPIHTLIKDDRFKAFLWLKLFTSVCLFTLSFLKINSPILVLVEFCLIMLFTFRSFYGLDGAYHMSLVVLGSLLLISVFGFNSSIAKLAVYYITAQLILSYFIAGIKKLLSKVWRNGSAMELIFRTEAFGNKHIFKLINNNKFIRVFSSWSVILFETFFFLIIFLDNRLAIYFFIIAFLFHLMVAIFMGLNNFLLVFASSYPIAFYCVHSTNFLYLAIPVFFYLITPILLISWLWNSSSKTVIDWIFRMSVAGIYLINIYIGGFLKISGLGYITTYFLFLFFFVSSLKSFYSISKIKKSQKRKESSSKHLVRICYSFLVLFTGLSIWEISSAIKGSKSPGGEIELQFPLKSGSYYVMQGGNNNLLNHHYDVPGQKYALDIVKINKFGLRVKKLMPTVLDDYNIFKTNLYSPVSGTVIKISNTSEDFLPPKVDTNSPAGNYIILKIENTDKAILLAHLMKNSIRVSNGDKVKAGQLIGQVGNSGNTSEPHLHIHCVKINKRGDFLFNAESIPMTFDKSFLVRNSVYNSIE